MISNEFWYTEEGRKLLIQGGARVVWRMGCVELAKEMEKEA